MEHHRVMGGKNKYIKMFGSYMEPFGDSSLVQRVICPKHIGIGLGLGLGLGLASNFGICTTPFRTNEPLDK